MSNKPKEKLISAKVVKISDPKTLVVQTYVLKIHPIYRKKFLHTKKYFVDNKNADIKKGDQVLIAQVKPISRLKRWSVVRKVSQ